MDRLHVPIKSKFSSFIESKISRNARYKLSDSLFKFNADVTWTNMKTVAV